MVNVQLILSISILSSVELFPQSNHILFYTVMYDSLYIYSKLAKSDYKGE